ncbi:MAG TPA: hypothetical protein V6D17_01110 [Candidatus Obscuribacterales bacterium]
MYTGSWMLLSVNNGLGGGEGGASVPATREGAGAGDCTYVVLPELGEGTGVETGSYVELEVGGVGTGGGSGS